MKTFLQKCILLLLLMSSYFCKAQAPVLNSYPSAAATIFLDFDGHSVSGTSWNAVGDFYCEQSGLSNNQIQEVFNRVAEDYRPFNINITTDSTKFWLAPISSRVRIIITPSSSWYGSAGGVAFLNSFIWGDNTPAFVFSNLLQYNIKNISEATSHEAGHTLGLFHQASYDNNCVKISDYNSGTGSGEIGWAPIMGVGYSKNFTTWNYGPNSFGCDNMQSDLEIITEGYSGVSYREDDHSNQFATATIANFMGNQYDIKGIIEKNTDDDIVKFTVPIAGHFELDAIPYNVGTGNSGSNLDMQVTLYNHTLVMLNSYNPGTLLSSLIDTTLNAGTYYLRIEGKGNQYASSYASLGSYSLVGTITTNTSPLPVHKLELSAAPSGDNHKLNWDIIADESIVDIMIEASTDARAFVPLSKIGNATRTFSYHPEKFGTIFYRLQVRFDNGKTYYSNTVAVLSTEQNTIPKILGNPIIGNNILINSPKNYNYELYSINGNIIKTGQINTGNNTIHTDKLMRGMYVIRLFDGQQQHNYKILHQ